MNLRVITDVQALPHDQLCGRDLSEMVLDAPDVHLALVSGSGEAVAACCLWWSGTPALEGDSTGYIGHYFSDNPNAGQQLLKHALDYLSQQGVKLAVGPINGATSSTYRFQTDRGTTPRFFLEPEAPEAWLADFRSVGFEVLKEYLSTAGDLPPETDPGAPPIAEKLLDEGFVFRNLNPADDDDLRMLYRMSMESFANNFLFSPIPEETFLVRNRKLGSLLDPELFPVAMKDGHLVGYGFGVEDVNNSLGVPTIIMKTGSVLPAFRKLGIARVLSRTTHVRAYEKGCRKSIHALMTLDNRSRDFGKYGHSLLRRYALFSREISPSDSR